VHSDLVVPRTKDNKVDLIGLVFERAIAVPDQVKEAFPRGCPNGTVSAILETAKTMNPTNDPAYSAWLLYRWVEGKLTLTDMQKSTDILEQYASNVGQLPLEARNVFGMHTLDQMKAVLELAVPKSPQQSVRIFSSADMVGA